jgi:hypothetical protein
MRPQTLADIALLMRVITCFDTGFGISQAHKWQFATTDLTALHFGHDRHACPGRFMAGNIIKLVLADLLLGYDFRLDESFLNAEGRVRRPRSWSAFEYSFPNPMAKVWFRRRAVGRKI